LSNDPSQSGTLPDLRRMIAVLRADVAAAGIVAI
jgi:hypothetical protein